VCANRYITYIYIIIKVCANRYITYIYIIIKVCADTYIYIVIKRDRRSLQGALFVGYLLVESVDLLLDLLRKERAGREAGMGRRIGGRESFPYSHDQDHTSFPFPY
jgi:hypothetical protein